ncbi:uncharacterized protein LOC115757249 [Rhodamnia argentea]|uniref:Uncharacterized protein LOC115757249 n=1 Tax=Rhodamnia argentea TaxID=178133 RepID=A0A8B8R3S7_9MYRT|nr:uncharacterized protein LOC115757249 [Rhodamnia argentea]
MDFFTKTTGVKLRSHLDKYLAPGAAEGEPVRQIRGSGHSRSLTWAVERVEGKSHLVRLRSCQGGYLAATDDSFLLGMTGNKVVVVSPTGEGELDQWNTEWEPIRDGFQVRLKSWCGKYLRANGGTPPWRNSVTHDEPYTGSTRKWILWDVEAVEAEAAVRGALGKYLASLSSLSSVAEDALSVFGSDSGGSPRESNLSNLSFEQDQFSNHSSNKLRSGMDFFRKAKAVRLRSHHHKFLHADEDEESVTQDRKGSSKNAKWTVEVVSSNNDENSCLYVRLKGCYGRYLTASNKPLLLGGISGCKVLQTLPRRLDSSVEWEPIREGSQVKLRTRYGNFLRANKGFPPLKDSVTHGIPHRTTTQDWILWDVDIVEIEVDSPSASDQLGRAQPIDHDADLSMVSENSFSSVSEISGNLSRQESSDSLVASLLPLPVSPPPNRVTEGRIIYYHIADENGEVVGEDMEGYCLNNFKGNTVEELSRKLSEETGIDSLVVCSRNPLNGKLFPLRLRLPPNIIMHVVVVPSFSSAASDFTNQAIL